MEEGDDFDVAKRLYNQQQQGLPVEVPTMLTRFFEKMSEVKSRNPNSIEASLTYLDWPQYFYWNKKNKTWIERAQSAKDDPWRIVKLGMVSSNKRELLVNTFDLYFIVLFISRLYELFCKLFKAHEILVI
jgi:hypothetical protein